MTLAEHHTALPVALPRGGAEVRVVAQQGIGGGAEESPKRRRISELLREGLAAEEAAAEALAQELEEFVTGSGVDAILARLGSDLVDDQARAALMALSMADVVDELVAAGIDDVWESTAIAALPELRRVSVAVLESVGIEGASLLDAEGMAATLTALEDHLDEAFWRLGIVTPVAGKLLDGLSSTLRMETIEDVAERLRGQGYRWDHANTEARNALAYYSNFVNDKLIDEADPTGEEMLIAYQGPDDRLTRPFCDQLVGKAFLREDLDKADNGVKGLPYQHNHGGHKCRHREVGVPNDDDLLEALGYTRGTLADVRRANAAARRKKGRKR